MMQTNLRNLRRLWSQYRKREPRSALPSDLRTGLGPTTRISDPFQRFPKRNYWILMMPYSFPKK